MIPFRYASDLLNRFPRLSGGAMLGTRIENGPTPENVREAFIAEQKAVLERVGSTPFSEIETLVGWRGAFRLFGVDPTQYRSAAEALLRRLTKKGDIPSINTVVDICNLVSIRYGLPVAAFDLWQVQGPITVRFATGEEWFTPLGETTAEHPEPGEVIFIDEAGLVVARRWCWRQSEESASRESTREALFTIEAQHTGGQGMVERALADLHSLLEKYASGSYQHEMLLRNEN
jgi:DNA/RNA-binding domain of Phe-tRNA-synthetase-like protein